MLTNRIFAVMLCTCTGAGSLLAAPVGRCGQIAAVPAVIRSVHYYKVPPIALTNQFGRKVALDKVLTGNKPVLVQFFFASCTTICSMRNAQLVAIAPKLAKAGIAIELYTISIDPDRDTPANLLAYSRKFGVDPPANWQLLTGSADQVKQVQAAFDASDPSGDRMMHKPLTFIRGGANQPWVRIDEMMSGSELIRQIKLTVAMAGR